MVSFVCNYCQETLKKPKLDQHFNRCPAASFSCIDCGTDFQGTSYRAHTSCISEAEKYQGKLYKAPKKKGQVQAKALPTPAPTSIGEELKKRKSKEDAGEEKEKKKSKKDSKPKKDEPKETLSKVMIDTLLKVLETDKKSENGMSLKDLRKKTIKKLAKEQMAQGMDKSALEKAFDGEVKMTWSAEKGVSFTI